MPGMLGHSLTFDERMKLERARDAEEDRRDALWREHQGMLGRASMARILEILQGGQPTRESTEEWMLRKQMMRGLPPPGGMLQQRIDGRIVPHRGPPRRPTPSASSVRG